MPSPTLLADLTSANNIWWIFIISISVSCSIVRDQSCGGTLDVFVTHHVCSVLPVTVFCVKTSFSIDASLPLHTGTGTNMINSGTSLLHPGLDWSVSHPHLHNVIRGTQWTVVPGFRSHSDIARNLIRNVTRSLGGVHTCWVNSRAVQTTMVQLQR